MYQYKEYGRTNIDVLLDDVNAHEIVWTVPSNSDAGDIVVFACARTAKDHMAHVCVQVRSEGKSELLRFAEEQRAKYNKYSGRIIGAGVIEETPRPDDAFGQRAYSAKISRIRLLNKPIDLSEFKGDIKLSTFSAHTKLNHQQWELLQIRLNEEEMNSPHRQIEKTSTAAITRQSTKKANVEQVLNRYVKESYGYIFLPAELVKTAQEAIMSECENTISYVKESKTGIRTLRVDKVGKKRVTKEFEIYIR